MPHPTRPPQDLLFVDVETTGLDPLKHELIEVAALRTSPDAITIKEEYTAKIAPLHIETAEKEALQVNGYTAAGWTPDKCKTPYEVIVKLQPMSAGTVLVGQNVSFDESFLLPLFRLGDSKAPWDYHKVDTSSMAWPLFVNGDLPGLSLSKLCKYFDVPTVPTHRALADVHACREVYLALLRRYAIK